MKKSKKRGVKPGTKRGPYRKIISPNAAKIDQLTAELKKVITEEIKYFNQLLRKLK